MLVVVVQEVVVEQVVRVEAFLQTALHWSRRMEVRQIVNFTAVARVTLTSSKITRNKAKLSFTFYKK